jgi:hypothetical protein
LIEGPDRQTHFWKRTIQLLFHQKFVLIEQIVVNLITHLGVLALFSSNFKKRLSLNCKKLQHVKIFLPCNFEVNPITHFGVIALFSSKIKKKIDRRARPPDTFLEENLPMTISSKVCSY